MHNDINKCFFSKILFNIIRIEYVFSFFFKFTLFLVSEKKKLNDLKSLNIYSINYFSCYQLWFLSDHVMLTLLIYIFYMSDSSFILFKIVRNYLSVSNNFWPLKSLKHATSLWTSNSTVLTSLRWNHNIQAIFRQYRFLFKLKILKSITNKILWKELKFLFTHTWPKITTSSLLLIFP